MGFGVWGLGFGVWALGFGLWGLGFGVRGLGFGVWGFRHHEDVRSGLLTIGGAVCVRVFQPPAPCQLATRLPEQLGSQCILFQKRCHGLCAVHKGLTYITTSTFAFKATRHNFLGPSAKDSHWHAQDLHFHIWPATRLDQGNCLLAVFNLIGKKVTYTKNFHKHFTVAEIILACLHFITARHAVVLNFVTGQSLMAARGLEKNAASMLHHKHE